MDTIVFAWIQLYPCECQRFRYAHGMINNPELLKSIAYIIEKIREEKGMSKSLLADCADIQRCYLRQIEQAKKNPSVAVLFSICEALDIHPVDFFRMVTDEMEKMKRDS